MEKEGKRVQSVGRVGKCGPGDECALIGSGDRCRHVAAMKKDLTNRGERNRPARQGLLDFLDATGEGGKKFSDPGR